MKAALEQVGKRSNLLKLQAQEAYNAGEVPVGCVFVHKGEIIGRGRNRTNETLNGTSHAEFVAIDRIMQAGHSWEVFATTDLYVTVEPCVMCASALRHLNIRKVYFGCGNDKFGGCGNVFAVHQDTTSEGRPYEAEGGYYREEAIMMLRRFYLRQNDHGMKARNSDATGQWLIWTGLAAPAPKRKAHRVLKTDIC
ncbi:cytidine deaminase-like protein [Fimicolochytrium jonesii]|uniref:cytidine deaminase-like protein n=1 Tax=Fimicolochytrium jonesii TaxID=1396493 RepID=UPI0022FE5863|nr:cytidine deaminase-like protein [Fimicolochytrium jonesii]KAI8822146.1 cytidine deaminase-like protein [Fimicolochytrium jonesii]